MNSRYSRKVRQLLFLLFAYCINGYSFSAELTRWQDNRLIPLQRITVGPWDNFSPAPTLSGETIYLTQTQNQIPQIIRYSVPTRKTELLVGQEGDAKTPALNADASVLAYTSFEHDARGDVCLMQLKDHTNRCITSESTIDSNPFWIDLEHVGLLKIQPGQQQLQLVSYNIKQNAETVLYSGNISAPAASPDGRYIIFNVFNASGVNGREWKPYLLDLTGSNTRVLSAFDLPGIPGFYAFSEDGQHLYFNHYLSDTNRDQLIDGNDHSVAFRIAFEQFIKADQLVFPEQLTSVEDNCSFPALSKDSLFLTCAYEGSLDIYQTSLTGTVPDTWDETKLWEAHKIARSTEQRQLLINTLRFRLQTNDETTQIDLLERLLSLHLQTEELTAVSYYLKQLQLRYSLAKDESGQKAASFYGHLELLTDILFRKALEPQGILTARFERYAKKTRKDVDTISNWPFLKLIISAYIDVALDNSKAALKLLEKVPLDEDGSLSPLESYLAFELYRETLASQPQLLLSHYPAMFESNSLTLESRIYYAFNYLKLLASEIDNPQTHINNIRVLIDERQSKELNELFTVEEIALELSEEGATDKGNILFKKMSSTLNNNRENPLLRKAMHTRAIQILGDARLFNYMELMSRNWLLNTHISEMEFSNTAEQYSLVTMDKAYGMLADGELNRAYATFYSAIRQTADLEAHYQFITTGLTRGIGKEENLKKSYELLEKQKILGDRSGYVEALRLLIATDGSEEKERIKALFSAKELLRNPVRGLGAAMHDLMLGYIAHSQLELSRRGFSYDEELFQEAHHHYILALDLGRDNSRISAAVWENLAWLHFEVRHYALAVDFFQKRIQLPFIDAISEAACRLSYARSLFYNNDTTIAWKESENALDIATGANLANNTAYLEKAAFYAMQAKSYPQAAEHYNKLLGSKTDLSPHNKVRSQLAYAYTQIQLNKQSDAKKLLLEVIGAAKKLKQSRGNRLLTSFPQRQELIANGLLAQMATNEQEKIRFRSEHLDLLRGLKGKSQEFALKESQRLSQITRDLNQLAASYEKTGQLKEMANTMQLAVSAALDWKQESGDSSGPALYHTLLNYMSLAIDHKKYFANADDQRITIALSELLESIKPLIPTSPQLAARAELIKSIQTHYQSALFGSGRLQE